MDVYFFAKALLPLASYIYICLHLRSHSDLEHINKAKYSVYIRFHQNQINSSEKGKEISLEKQ